MRHYGVEMKGPFILPDENVTGTTEGEIRYNKTTGIVEVKDGSGNFEGIKNDDRYYTETELDSGALDSRYFTESEANSNYRTQTWITDNIYTKTELNNGALDALYYSESEIDSKLATINNRLTGPFGVGGSAGSSYPTLRSCNIDSDGDIASQTGTDLMLNSAADTTPDQEFIAGKIWNAVWNDIADFQELAKGEEIEYGKVYRDTKAGMKKCFKRLQMGCAGIASDTFGFGVGAGKGKIPIAVAGYVLAFVDKEYDPGTPLINNKDSILTKATLNDKRKFPERIMAVYKKKEKNKKFGIPGKEIDVNGRCWVRVL